MADCPNRSNAYHECNSYCRKRYGLKKFEPHPVMEKRRIRMLKIYPLPALWKEVADLNTYNILISLKTNKKIHTSFYLTLTLASNLSVDLNLILNLILTLTYGKALRVAFCRCILCFCIYIPVILHSGVQKKHFYYNSTCK